MNIRDTIAAINQMQAAGVIESGPLDPARFQAILSRHELQQAWKRFEKQFLDDAP